MQPDRVLLRWQIARFAPKMTGYLLDVGSADGKRYSHLFKNITQHKTLDIDAGHNPDIVGSAEDIPIDENSIDSILCTQVLEHIPHPQKAISEMYRVLKPGGFALVTVPQLNELHEEPHDYFRYTCFGLKTICEEVGFEVVDIDQRGGYHACKTQMKIRYWIDRLNPYKRKVFMIFLAPLSMILTRFALMRDKFDKSKACKKNALGWAILLQKPS